MSRRADERRHPALAPLRGAWIGWQIAIGLAVAFASVPVAGMHPDELTDHLLGALVLVGVMQVLPFPLTAFIVFPRLARPITRSIMDADGADRPSVISRLLLLGAFPVLALLHLRSPSGGTDDRTPYVGAAIMVALGACALVWLLGALLVTAYTGLLALLAPFAGCIGTVMGWGVWSER